MSVERLSARDGHGAHGDVGGLRAAAQRLQLGEVRREAAVQVRDVGQRAQVELPRPRRDVTVIGAQL